MIKTKTAIALIAVAAIAGGAFNAHESVSKAKAKCPQIPFVREGCEAVMTPVVGLGGFGDGAIAGGQLMLVALVSYESIRWLQKRFKLLEIAFFGGCSLCIIVVSAAEFGLNIPAIALPIDVESPTEASATGFSGEAMSLFDDMDSLGVLAIGHAEGNFSVDGQKTDLYLGHTDPGNFKKNQGWCSDQGRGGGDVNRADKECLQRAVNQLGKLNKSLKDVGIDPNQNLEVAINLSDLYNQAAPWVSENFPRAYKAVVEAGYKGTEAIAVARAAAFIREGVTPSTNFLNSNPDASGLLGICQRENRGLTPWQCVYHDQNRRASAIKAVLSYEVPTGSRSSSRMVLPVQLPASGTSISQGFHSIHEGMDFAAPEGTLIYAIADGVVEFSGVHTGGLGNAVSIRHTDGSRSVYGHNQKNLVKVGDRVLAGQQIATVGNTGNSTGPHLHLEIREAGTDRAIDPSTVLPL